MKNYGYIYITTNLINNKIYIGQKKGIFDKSYLGSGVAILKAIKKYGKENFTVKLFTYCKTLATLNKAEIKTISLFDSCNDEIGYNRHEGGGMRRRHHLLQISKNLISTTNKERYRTGQRKSWNKGNKITGIYVKCENEQCNNIFYKHRSVSKRFCSHNCVII